MPRSEFAKKTLLGIVPADSPFYSFHPVTRLTLLFVLSVTPMFIDRPEINLAIIATTFGLFWWGRVRMSDLKKYRLLLVTVALFMFVVAYLAPGEKAQLTPVKLAGLTLYWEPMRWAFVSYVRLMAMLFGAILYFSTNRERDVLVGLRTLHLPFPVSYVAGLSLRSAGLFMEDFATIREAEQARALDLDALSLREKVKLYTMYTVPLFAVALRRADEIAAALYARGYTLSGRPGTGGKRTDYLRGKFVVRARDWVASLGLLGAFALIAIVSRTTSVFSVDSSSLIGFVEHLLGIG